MILCVFFLLALVVAALGGEPLVKEVKESAGDFQDGPLYQVLQKYEGYEERKYASHQTVCTSEDVPDIFPEADEDFDAWDKRQGLRSFQLEKLQGYLEGKNKDNAKVDFPQYPRHIHVLPHANGTVTRTMCIMNKIENQTPEPIDPELSVDHFVPETRGFFRFIPGKLNEFNYRTEVKTLMENLLAGGQGDEVDFSSYCIFIYESQAGSRFSCVGFARKEQQRN